MKTTGGVFLYAPFANYAETNLDVCREMLTQANTVPGLGDGGAHVRAIADGSFPDLYADPLGPRPGGRAAGYSWLVMRQTKDTAAAVGLMDRGGWSPPPA